MVVRILGGLTLTVDEIVYFNGSVFDLLSFITIVTFDETSIYEWTPEGNNPK